MAHFTARSDYDELVDRLNRFPQGAPPSEVLTKILKICLLEYFYEKSITSAIAATIAAVFWAYTYHTRQLITCTHFGISNIVLAFTVICSFSAICWYLARPACERKRYSYLKLILIAFVMSLPIMAKNVLGAIPAATFFILLLYTIMGGETSSKARYLDTQLIQRRKEGK